ncbi:MULTISPECIES: amino acid ABC transporter permease [unclassified Bosea (in: a-proteobacteria)]|uniref:amino acid ABC transporter permease n=1 Tax=unclassified Bosea (in: a-proteobacteria) TaxID=2653178 RepID=UPI000F75D44E|nr:MULTISPECIES: amino acid ABC transporter permease [unclassified Bosea (in: a-proteobacteria)]AZO77026.1 ABC transporter permease [Bosea sp. Tri-49]RXT21872.1 ABC transporter permease [Bosea sp. Tri-39]RXT32211.1 ABC transporter permease [Bosea sp. Tri-54]
MIAETDDLTIVPRRHFGRLIGAAAVCLALAAIVRAFAVGQIEWDYVAEFLTVEAIMKGLVNTIVMAILAMLLGITLGVVFAVMRLSTNPVLSMTAVGYIWFFRAVPALLQLLLWFNLALVFPTIGIPGLFSFKTVDVMTPFVAALLGLGIQQGAFTAEVVRAGLLSVDNGQYEAAQTLGMTRLKLLRRIIMPQAMRVIVPPIGNEFIGMVKLTSLASVIQFAEILHSAQNIYYANSRVIELLIVAAIWYLVVVTILSLIQGRIEAYYARGVAAPARR